MSMNEQLSFDLLFAALTDFRDSDNREAAGPQLRSTDDPASFLAQRKKRILEGIGDRLLALHQQRLLSGSLAEGESAEEQSLIRLQQSLGSCGCGACHQ
jgi:hypothetical protein